MSVQLSREDVEEFVKEGRDYFTDAEPKLILLASGNDADSEASIAYLFRVFHSIKGVAGFLSLGNIQTLAHKVENILDMIRSGKLKMSEEVLIQILPTCDLIKRLIEYTNENNNDLGYQEEVDSVIQSLVEFTHALMGESNLGLNLPQLSSEGLFSCFGNSAFIETFRKEYEQVLSQFEMALFELLDAPEKASEVAEVGHQIISTLELNLKVIQINFGHELISEVKSVFKNNLAFSIFTSDGLGLLFKFCEFLKVGVFYKDAESESMAQELLVAIKAFNVKPEKKVEEEKEKNNSEVHASPKSTVKHDDMRVEVEKIDKLIELIEELGVVTGVVTRDPESDSFNIYIFQQAANKLKQITEALQDVAMSVRLVPLSSTFNKMQRLCFDVSHKLNKKVKLVTMGENTEIDKNMVEAIQDPLLHIFRNAIDHGLETPEERLKSKKAEIGTIELKAWHGGGEVFLSIRDDGHGIDPQKILQKAKEKGIVDTNENSLSHKQILNLIFEAGFSTAAEVTDFSGRGVGMDVVKKAVEKLNGQIEIFSEIGEGTTFLLSFPLTSTIVEGMLVKVGNFTYTIRIASVRESLKVAQAQIVRTPDGKESIKVRNAVYPVIRLHQLNKTRNFKTDISDGILVLVENKGVIAALLVDEILGTNHNVIKALPSYFNKLRGVAGCSVIGTGTADISWTVDINSLMSKDNGVE